MIWSPSLCTIIIPTIYMDDVTMPYNFYFFSLITMYIFLDILDLIIFRSRFDLVSAIFLRLSQYFPILRLLFFSWFFQESCQFDIFRVDFLLLIDDFVLKFSVPFLVQWLLIQINWIPIWIHFSLSRFIRMIIQPYPLFSIHLWVPILFCGVMWWNDPWVWRTKFP